MTTVEDPVHTLSEGVNQALDEAMSDDETVFCLGEDIEDPIGGVMRGTRGLSTKYGRARVRNTPIAEQAIVGCAIGASLAGMRPVAEVMLMDFFAVCMDQVANHAAKLRYMSGGRTNVPITIRTSVGGGAQFGAQHSQSLEGWMMHIPGLKVVVPSTPRDAKGLLYSAIFDDDPCIHMETMSLLFTRGPVPAGHFAIPLGSAEVKRPGTDVTVIAWGKEVPEALAAAETLAGEGTDVEVLDLRTLVPLDRQAILDSVAKTRRAVVVHAATTFAGPGAEIASLVSHELFGELAAPVERLGAAYAPIPFAAELETALYPDRGRIAETIRAMA
ncbi:MAG TPA: pyruvate dehydrogenase complex E1 component subunit beta [Acidimicrobiales bacterium]|nr:pyruvate dehydrogenase complex E1 component subunit beta [Acidimicrobiales bacterium]